MVNARKFLKKENTMVLNFLIFMVFLSQINKTQPEKCYSESTSPYVYFSSKTSYFASRNPQINVPKNCEAIYIWGLIRHGTRYPEISFINSMEKLYKLRDEIILNHKNGRGDLCQQDMLNLEKWRTNLTNELVKEYSLCPQGKKDQIFLAQKLKEIFPNLLKLPKKEKFTFQTSGQARTKDSAIAFTNELIGTNFTSTKGNSITEDVELLHLCERHSKEIENNPVTYTEVNLFKKSTYFQKIIAEISIRLGFKQLLPIDLIILMYDICAYENAWYLNSRPPFCAAFLSNELETFDYLFDMSRYYKTGYGNPFSHQIGCPLVRDMMISLQNAARNDSIQAYKGKFLFSHTEKIVPITVKMGFHKDDEFLRHDNYEKMIKKRNWRLASFNSFASNVIAVLYKCFDQNDTRTKVVIYQNERSSVFPQCDNSSLCNLETLQQMYSDVFDENECNSKFCQLSLDKISSGYSNSPNLNIFIIIFLTSCFLR